MIRAALLFCALALAALPGRAEPGPPRLAVFVTDADADVYVAIWGDKALELRGCATAAAARELLQLPPDATVSETRLEALTADFAYGAQPGLPCAGHPFDADWPATTPIWADVAQSGAYYLPMPSGSGYLALPASCAALKTALAIRERLQLPGVLQGSFAPPDLGTPALSLSCGAAAAAPVGPAAGSAETGWTLHRFEIFLSEDSTLDTIYVARSIGAGGVPAYLPILRLDGRDSRDILLEGGPAMRSAEAELAALIGAAPDAPATLLGAEAGAAIRAVLFVDLCLQDCAGYAHAPAAFLQPGVDLAIAALPPLLAEAGLDALGRPRLRASFAEGRSARFTGCARLTAAMGLAAAEPADWFAATATALEAEPPPGTAFECGGARADICTRQVPDGGSLSPALLAPGSDCAGKTELRIELAGRASAAEPLLLQDLAFTRVALLPQPGLARARLVITPGRLASAAAPCVLSGTDALIVASGIAELSLYAIDLERKATDAMGEVVALQVQGGRLMLQDVSIGNQPDGSAAVQRGVNLCRADLYARASRISAETIAVQGLASRVMLSGDAAQRASLGQARFGLLMAQQSQVRLQQTDIAATNPIVLRGAELRASGIALAPLAAGVRSGSALQLERGSSAEVQISRVAGFRCAASFLDAASRLGFLLPGNDIARDNTFSACGPGQFSLIE